MPTRSVIKKVDVAERSEKNETEEVHKNAIRGQYA